MPVEMPEISDLPELPAEIRQALERTFTYANDDETVRATARGDQTLSAVDVQVYEDSQAEQIASGLTLACRAALDEALEVWQTEVLATDLLDDELRAAMVGHGEPPRPGSTPSTYRATAGEVTAMVGPDAGLQRIILASLDAPDRIGVDTVAAVNQALLLARGGDDEDVESLAEQRLSELEATMEQLSAVLDPLSHRLDELNRSLDQA